MRRITRLVALRLLSGQLLAHGSGVSVLALALAVEGSELSVTELAAEILRTLPGLWSTLAPALALLGAAFAAARARRDGTLLALGTFGVAPTRPAGFALALGAAIGLAAGELGVAPTPPATEWARAEGGWIRGAEHVPDIPGGVVRPRAPAPPERLRPAASTAAATLAGGGLGLWAGAATVLVVTPVWLVFDVLARTLAERGAAPDWAVWLPGGLLLLVTAALARRGPLFPARGR